MRLLLAALVLAPLAFAQPPTPQPPTPQPPTPQSPPDHATLQTRRNDKLAQPFLLLHRWHTDLESAKREAAREGKPILVHCTRSFSPCGTSIRCEREVLSAAEFAQVAARAVLYCHVTARLDAGADQFLFDMRGSGWPHHAVLDASGRVLGTHASHLDKSVAELHGLLDRAQAYQQLEAEVAGAIAAQRRRQLEAGLATGALDLETARALLAQSAPLPSADAERLAAAVTDLEVGEVLRRHDRFDAAAQIAAGAELYALWRLGKRPAERNASRDFWGGILLHLEHQEQPDLNVYQDGLAQLEQRFGNARGYRAFLDARRKALEELQRKAGKPAQAAH